ncbi:tRNA (guanosine(46)-N7)-methyltransferase TrmB [Argonema galeatum]|uniref:tRNA (guanosine(46)-N7)-methyltransferase TrmB n=1 Tax=Argonema galeatum TaxID=2942762 RepID=UPI0020131100|nr:tRNA (guanosine(46)-N7)-methyltransferase TrmB [Argonema galeatum]MCL1466319.1 tRNA (guanosine(46)-N7)-methyltransferase TrmB [Argonema galeatum A003/A1]
MAAVRVRQHVNPLSSKYQTPTSPPDWTQIYADLTLPLHLDIGCAKGQFLLSMAQLEPDWNYLGLEIREPLVLEANKLRDEHLLQNLHYLFCNANNSLRPLLSSFPSGILQRVTIQFPDPWFKKRHQKRRVVQTDTVAELATYLASGGWVFIQSDVKQVAIEMCDRFHSHSSFQRTSSEWLTTNPLPVPTERERFTEAKGEPVYRALFEKS